MLFDGADGELQRRLSWIKLYLADALGLGVNCTINIITWCYQYKKG